MGHIGGKILPHFCSSQNIRMLLANQLGERHQLFVGRRYTVIINIYSHLLNRIDNTSGQDSCQNNTQDHHKSHHGRNGRNHIIGNAPHIFFIL